MTAAQKMNITTRTEAASKVRHSGFVPGVLYGQGVPTQPIQVDAKAFLHTWHKAGATSLVHAVLDSKEVPVLIRDVQFHPVKGHVLHIDLYQVNMKQAIRTMVPVTFIGVSPAVKDQAGILVHNVAEIELEALPTDLPHEISVDISSLTDFEKKIHLMDIPVPTGVTFMTDQETIIALVQPPRSEEELEKLSEEVKEDVAAVETVKKEEKAEDEEETDAGEASKADKKE